MKIALLIANFPLREGEDPVFPAAWELAKALQQRGHQILVLTITEDETAPERTEINGISVATAYWNYSARQTILEQVNVATFSWQIGRAGLIWETFSNELDRFQPDVIESQEFNGLAFFYAAERKYPLVIRCYGPLSLLMRQGDTGDFSISDVEMSESMELSTIASADALIAICRDLAGRMSSATGRPLSDFEIIRTPFTVSTLTLEQQNNGNNAAPRLFYFGNVHKQKGVDLLVEALPYIADQYPGFVLRVGGRDCFVAGYSERYSSKLKTRLAELGLANNVEFLGFLARDQIIKEVQQADVCVFPSKYETACYTCLEAVSYGGVCVAAAVGGLPEYHKHGDSVWLVEPHSPKHLAEGVLHVLSDVQLREHMRLSGRQHVAAVCDPDRIAAESLAVYERAIHTHQRYKVGASLDGVPRPDLAFSALSQRINTALNDIKTHEHMSKLLYKEAERGWHEGRLAGLQEAAQTKTISSLAWIAARAAKRLVGRSR